ncbi:MAG: hypothetical protein Q7J07_09900 [Pelolinea sp.]|nr:hypothetical protein [Pelolinea sp.]
MKISKNVIIAAAFICLAFVFIFLIYLAFLSRVVISIDDGSTIKITPRSYDPLNSNDAMDSTTPTPNPPGVYSKGMHVQIAGTGGDGLRIREFAGLDKTPLFLGLENEEFQIIDGPEIYDSSIWWKIRSVENSSKIGWAVQDYLNQF